MQYPISNNAINYFSLQFKLLFNYTGKGNGYVNAIFLLQHFFLYSKCKHFGEKKNEKGQLMQSDKLQ